MTKETGEENTGALNGGGGMPALEGYLYQIDVSVLAALDTLIVKKFADRLVLEPASQDDLEADLRDPESASTAADVDSSDYRIVVQAKFRGTAIWKPASLVSLLKHGKKRPSALKRLEDAHTRYLLVTTGATDTGIQELVVKNIGEWPRKAPSNTVVASLLAKDAHRRVAILQWSDEILKYKLEEYLERNFRVPRANIGDCLEQLRGEALERMRGARGGIWTRRELQELIRQHQGYFASSTELEYYVTPSKWPELVKQLQERYAVIIVGPSGTGKTTTASVLADKLQQKYPGTEIKHIVNGPGEISTDRPAGPVIYLVDDPWGRYGVGPHSEPWNDEMGRFLTTASANKYFIVTSRSDVYSTSKAKINPKWFVELDADDYTPHLRLSILEKRLQKLPRRLQDWAYPQRRHVADQLTLPLEIAKYVQSLSEGIGQNEKPDDFLRRVLSSAKNETIESIVAQQVGEQDVYAWAAVVWGVFKVGPNIERSVFSELQSHFADHDQRLDDGLERFVTFLESGHSLRQNERLLSYYHPRVEAGLLSALVEKPVRSRRILGMLADILMAMHVEGANNWPADVCAALIQAARAVGSLAGIKPSAITVVALDQFLIEKLLQSEKNYSGILRLASDAMSSGNDVAALCRWLMARQRKVRGGFGGFPPTWDPTALPSDVKQRLTGDKNAATILRKFVRFALAHDAEIYPDETWEHLSTLDSGISEAFVETARDSFGAGYYWHVDAVAAGAAQDLPSFWPVIEESLDFLAKLSDQPDDGTDLAIYNNEYSDDYAQHLAESAGEEGYSADEFIKTYVSTYRAKHGWKQLSTHPRVDEFSSAWLKAARNDKTPARDEIHHLAIVSRGTRWEDDYWYFAEKHWLADLEPLLLARLKDELTDHRLRKALLLTGLRCASGGVPQLVSILAGAGDRQILTALDDARDLDERDIKDAASSFTQALEATANTTVKVVFEAMTSKEAPLKLVPGAVALISGMSRPNYPSWQVRRARLLSVSGVDVAGLIDDLLTTEDDWLSNTIPAAAEAVNLAAELRLDAVVDSAIFHQYAAVREVAMQIIATRTSGNLPPEILALADDRSSSVKTALLNLIETRSGQYAVNTVVKLAGDRWSSASIYYGERAHFDIAQKAADLLPVGGIFNEDDCLKLMDLAATSDDNVLAQKLYAAVLRGGNAAGEAIVLEYALGRGKVRPKVAALNALAARDDILDVAMLSRATSKEIIERGGEPAALLAFLVGWKASEDHALATAKEVAVSTRRAAMLFPLWIGAERRGGDLHTKVESLFPSAMMTDIKAIEAADGVLSRIFLNPLGDPEAVDGVMTAFSYCFEKKAKE